MGMIVGEHYQKYIIRGYALFTVTVGGMTNGPIAYIASEEDAKEWCKKSPRLRTYAPFEKVFRIAHDLEGLQAIHDEDERDRALAKLTPRERELLGL